jgi:predicted N-acetyltransferase YhbS
MQAGIDHCRKAAVDLVFVLGHKDYYPRFGFQPSSRRGLHYKGQGMGQNADEYFFVLELTSGTLDSVSGSVSYHFLFSG